MSETGINAAVRAAKGGSHFYSARLIGSFDLVDSAGEPALPRGRRARGLLAYLILGPRHDVARDMLAALLWSERGDEQARASLRQALFELRPVVGPDRLLSVTRTAVRLNGDAIMTDLEQLDQAAERDDLPGILAVFGEADATLLADMREIDPAFDDWLALRRSQWREKRRTLALQAIHGAAATQAPEMTLHLAQLIALADPLDEIATVSVMESASAIGDIATIRRAFANLAHSLRQELNVEPSPATVLAYQHLVSKVDVASPASPAERGHMSQELDGRPPPQRRVPGWRPLTALGLVAAVGASMPLTSLLKSALVTSSTTGSGIQPAPIDPDSVVTIQPLASEPGDLKTEAVRDGLQSAVVRHLTGSGTPVQVVDKGSKNKEPNGLTMRGNGLEDHGVLRANIELVANPSGKVVWAESFIRPTRQVDQFIEQIGIQVARELHCAYADGRQRYIESDPELARLSLSHCDTLGRDLDEAVRYDWQITRRAPTFARGWAEYAMDTALVAQTMPLRLKAQGFSRAQSFARRALAIDPHQGLAYAALVVAIQDRSWPEQLALVRAGLAADPASPELHIRQSFMMAKLGRSQDALGEAMAAYHYDHLLPAKLINRALTELASGDIDGARDDLALGQTYWPSLRDLDQVVIALGVAGVEPERALNLVKTRARGGIDPQYAPLAAFLVWRVAPTSASRLAAITTINTAATRDEGSGREIYLLALLGCLDEAYDMSDRLPVRGVDPGWFDADLAGFRRDPRFMRLMQRTGITTAWQQTSLWPDFCDKADGIRECRNALRLVN